jgi:hypothetical protein
MGWDAERPVARSHVEKGNEEGGDGSENGGPHPLPQRGDSGINSPASSAAFKTNSRIVARRGRKIHKISATTVSSAAQRNDQSAANHRAGSRIVSMK